MPSSFDKDPQAVLDYKIDWSSWLGTDTITASTWSADTGITIDSNEFNDTETVVWLSGGTEYEQYTVTNHITTLGGREDDRSLTIKMKNK